MRRLKERVKAGELPASEALEQLKAAAERNNDIPHVLTTKTWRWLLRRTKEERA